MSNEVTLRSKFTDSLAYARANIPPTDQLARNVNSLVVPALVLTAALYAPTASADKFTDCMDKCFEIEHDLLSLICQAGCLVFAR